MTVEVKIGVQNASRELVVESNQSTEDITAALREALGAGDDSAVFSLTDAKARSSSSRPPSWRTSRSAARSAARSASGPELLRELFART